MYKPEEITNSNLLSSYLRTSLESLNKYLNSETKLIDWRSGEIETTGKSKTCILIQRFYIPKNNVKLGYRVVYKLRSQFAIDILKVIKFNLYDIYSPKEYVHGFIPRRDTLTNAQCHLNKKHLLKIDIKNFFNSITKKKVEEAYKKLHFIPEIAGILSNITTLNGTLPPGFSTSPILANIVFEEVDDELNKICKKKNAIYTRYADDISISSDDSFCVEEELEEALLRHGYSINKTKSRKFKRGQNQFVTGLSIANKDYPRIPKAIKRKLRQELYYINLYGYHSHVCHTNGLDKKTSESTTIERVDKLRNRIKGWIDYINHIEPTVARKFYSIFNLIEQQRIEKLKKLIE